MNAYRTTRWISKLLLITTILTLTACQSKPDPQTLDTILKELDVSFDHTNEFVINESILREGKENTFWTILAQRQDTLLKLEIVKNIDSQTARQYIQERTYAINSLYQNIPSAYPGMITNSTEIQDELKPAVAQLTINREKIPVYLLYSTARFTYGATTRDLIKYRGALTFVFIPVHRTLLRIELFQPKEKSNDKDLLRWLSTLSFIGPNQKDHDKKTGGAVVHSTKYSAEPSTNKRSITQEGWGSYKDYNLIIIGFEPLGAKHVGAYGYSKNTTPNLDKFSTTAFLFRNAISPSSWTLPVFMSWFTSLYPSQHKLVNKYSTYTDTEQILSNLTDLSPSVVTLAQVLKSAGYKTAGFTGGAALTGTFGYRLGFDTYFDNVTFGGFELAMPKALKWLQTHKDNKFFLFVAAYDVHGRYPLPQNYNNKFADPNYTGKYKGNEEEYWELRNRSVDRLPLNLTQEDVKFWESIYDAKILGADKRFKAFVEQLKTMGLMDNTIIIVSSGSGNEYYEHNAFDHGLSLYDELIHVPLIIKIPDREGHAIESQVRTIDIMPTVLDLLQIDYEQSIARQMQGTSLVPLLSGQHDLQLDAFSETDYLLQVFKRSWRTHDGWKYIHSLDTEKRELYHLVEDPQELNNLIHNETKIAYELEQKLFKHLNTIKGWAN